MTFSIVSSLFSSSVRSGSVPWVSACLPGALGSGRSDGSACRFRVCVGVYFRSRVWVDQGWLGHLTGRSEDRWEDRLVLEGTGQSLGVGILLSLSRGRRDLYLIVPIAGRHCWQGLIGQI